MANSSPKYTWCSCRKNKISSKDTHELCLHCLGIQHAKEAVLEYGKCPHCSKMDWSTCINRLTKVQEVMHLESQQRKFEATQAKTAAKPETGPSPCLGPVASSSSSSSVSQPAVMPLMFTVQSPPTLQTEPGLGITTLSHVSSSSHQQPPRPASSHSCKRKHSSAHCCRPKHSCPHRCRRSPSLSSCSSQDWTSSSSSCSPHRERRSRKGKCRGSHQEKQLLEELQKKLEAQERALQVQWALMEQRIAALEKKENGVVAGISAGTQTIPFVVREGVGAESESSALPMLKSDGPGEVAAEEDEPPLLSESPLKMEDIQASAELQALIQRAAKYLGIDFPTVSGGISVPPDPTMVPEFEDLVQSTWSNPACSRPFRAVHAEMYRLHEGQRPAYERMPQVATFMSAIFRAVKPAGGSTSPPETMPSGRWHMAETLTNRMYQTSGMLARTANYLHYLADYHQRLLMEVTEERPARRFVEVLKELKLVARFTLQLSAHQAELAGRAMATSVAIRRQAWMAKTHYTDMVKATVADLPFVVGHAFGNSVDTHPIVIECKQEIP